jgi:hypothetical protein
MPELQDRLASQYQKPTCQDAIERGLVKHWAR